MAEKIIKESAADYLKSLTHLIKGTVILTNRRVFFFGEHARLKFDHGAIGNMIRDKMEQSMGHTNAEDDYVFDIPLQKAQSSLKRFGLSKRLAISDGQGNEYKLIINDKDLRNSWPDAIAGAKAAAAG